MRLKQQALLSKLAINLMLHPTSLWAQFVIVKYKFKGTWLAYSKPHKISFIWNKIYKAGIYFQHHLLWVVGSGTSIHAFLDPWISNVPLSQLPTYINVNNNLSSTMVASFIS